MSGRSHRKKSCALCAALLMGGGTIFIVVAFLIFQQIANSMGV